MPVVMKLSGVSGIAALTRRNRSHGSSRWKRTETAMCVLDEKSQRVEADAVHGRRDREQSGVVSPVALQRLWLPSRVVVSTMSTTRLSAGLHAEERRAELDQLARSRRTPRPPCRRRPRGPRSSSS